MPNSSDTGRGNAWRQLPMPGKTYLSRSGRKLYVKTIFVGSSFIAQSNSSKSGYALFLIDGVKKYRSEEAAQAALDRYAAERHLVEMTQ